VAVVQEAWISGVSPRRVDALAQAMGVSGIYKSTVSKLCWDIAERVNAFLDRPLTATGPTSGWTPHTPKPAKEAGVSGAAIISVAANERPAERERSSASGLGHPRQRPSGLTSRAVARPRGLEHRLNSGAMARAL